MSRKLTVNRPGLGSLAPHCSRPVDWDRIQGTGQGCPPPCLATLAGKASSSQNRLEIWDCPRFSAKCYHAARGEGRGESEREREGGPEIGMGGRVHLSQVVRLGESVCQARRARQTLLPLSCCLWPLTTGATSLVLRLPRPRGRRR